MKVDVARDARFDVLKAIAEPARWRIVERLAQEDLCVCHLVDDLGMTQPLISHHLKVLRQAGIVDSERYRQWTYYRLRTDALTRVADELSAVTALGRAEGERRRPCC